MLISERKLKWIVFGAILLVVCAVAGIYLSQPKASNLKVLKRLPPFTLTNQINETVSLSTLRGNVWLANIIFTRCPGPCARMTKQFAEIQAALPKDGQVKLVTLTADPGYDTVSVLNVYADRAGADVQRWNFLTGPKNELYHLAQGEGLMFAVQEKTPEEKLSEDDLFIHSTLFVLVDKRGNVRSFYESTDEGIDERILGDINLLLQER